MIYSSIKICFIKSYPSVKEGIFSLTGISKSQLKKFKISKSFLSKKILAHEVISLPINLLNRGMINPSYTGEKICIVYEDDTLLGISKPPEIHSHPLSYNETNNLLSWMSKEHISLLDINKKNYDRGLLYRLDFETSGLILYCKTEQAYLELRANFHSAVMSKEYLVIVEGRLDTHQTQTHFLQSTGINKSTVTAYNSIRDKCHEAQIEIIPLEYNQAKDISLIIVKLKQGHRHQIRVQLQAIGYSILGDKLYSGMKHCNSADRLFLHCLRYRLKFVAKVFDIEDRNFDLFEKFFDLDGKF